MFLRYGMEAPDKGCPPPPLLSYSIVANLLKLNLCRVQSLLRKYFQQDSEPKRYSLQPPTYKIQDLHTTQKVTLSNIEPEEVSYIISADSL